MVKHLTFRTKSLPTDFTDIWPKIGQILPHHTKRRTGPDHGDLHIHLTFAIFPQQFSRLLVNIQHYLFAVRLRDCWNTLNKWYSLLRT
jgi:hypothetical protein